MFDIENDLAEKNAKVDEFFAPEGSHLDLDSDMLKGDLGLGEYILESVPFDTLALNMVDQDRGLKQSNGFYYSANTDIKAWRRGVVMMVGSGVKVFKVGDMVIFPGVKGLPTGNFSIKNADGTITKIEDGHFISESRIFGKVTPIDN